MINQIGLRGRALALAVALSLVSGSAVAEDGAQEKTATATIAATLELNGKFVDSSGNRSKQLEDHNTQSGAGLALEVLHSQGDRTLHFDGSGQTGERQGYLNAEYDKLGRYGIAARFQSFREYYNSRRGGPAVTSSGIPLAFPNFFPYTNDGSGTFGQDTPFVDWLTTGVGGDVKFVASEDNCRFCRAKPICPEHIENVERGARDDFFPLDKDEDHLAARVLDAGAADLNWGERLRMAPLLRQLAKAWFMNI